MIYKEFFVMAFVAQTPRAFTKSNVLSINPGQVGVYGLFVNGRWIYVGKGDIRDRLLAHLNGDNSCITRSQPTHWVDEVTKGDPSEREKELILELNPVCNLKVG
jgi:hypothetical protein